jgi:hypothetical protein
MVDVLKYASDLITEEIKFHRHNPGGSGCNESYERGFIVGLQQARRLVRQLHNRLRKEGSQCTTSPSSR